MTTHLRASLVATCFSFLGCISALEPSYRANPQLLELAPTVVFQGSAGPMSYQAAVGRDGQRYHLAPRVRGRACQHGVQVPVLSIIGAALDHEGGRVSGALSAGWGEGTFAAAVDDARKQAPRGALLYDVRADLNLQSYLSVYRRQCILIDAGVLLPAASNETSPATL